MIKKIGLSLAAITLTLTLAAVAVGYYWYSNAAVFGASMTPAQQRSYITSSNFSETLFINQINTDMDQTFGLMAGALWDYVTAEGLAPEHNLEIVKADPSQLNNANNKTQLMWLGHSSFLLQSANQTLLFDPIFSDTAAPHPALGSKRYNKNLPIEPEQLPPIDAVIISHDHYDHLDYPSIMQLDAKVKHYYVPLGVGQHLLHWGIAPERISEMDWWQSNNLNSIKLTLTPARHFSGRRWDNRNSTLWGGWMVEAPDQRVFFSGDSGYGPHFKEIGQRFGPIDIALLDTGQYNFRWQAIHMRPKQSVQAAQDLDAHIMMPVHWGAFTLSLHPWDEPAEQTRLLAQQQDQAFVIPRIGELMRLLHEPIVRGPWWQKY
jgi:L-ascorbate metabolism protein UlaG (beta-lactamase superfamily)|tara:strand:- start:1303 stop:2430 length:1128 start_codon:yes stop_codon:yes gene_type:complete